MYKIVYHQLVVKKDIPRLTKRWKIKIRSSIEKRLTTKPDLYGKPLRRSLKHFRKLRVGDYRVIYKIEGLTVKILIIDHRSAVYKNINKRA